MSEDALMDEATKKVEPTESEMAAAKYAGEMNHFRKIVSRKGMSANALARVLIAAAEFPLGTATPKLKNREERFLFQLFHVVQASKNEFLEHLVKQNADALAKAEQITTPPEGEGEVQNG